LHAYEENDTRDARQNCIANGQEIWRTRVPGLMGGIYEWSPDNRRLAVSEAVSNYRRYSICTLNPDATLSIIPIADAAPSFVHWTSDQEWLYAVTVDCKLYRTDVDDNLSTEIVLFDSPCHANSAAWSQNDRFMALGTPDGLWLGSLSGEEQVVQVRG
jgi:hypothetical protein